MATLTPPRSDVDSPGRDSADWDLGVATGLIRIFAGIVLWRAPSTLIRLSGGSADDSLLRGLFRYFAVRDIALGVATLASTRPGGDVTRSLTLQGVADTTDGAAVGALVATGRLRRTQGLGAVGLAGVTALMEYAAAWKLRRSHG
ncbi:MAG TPA: hypothetical protein VFJ17_01545 [Mycobacteriales bacterium]|jgi:hypothetical protein|nr:hypothetical protein [Mycobacteriales bacterium]